MGKGKGEMGKWGKGNGVEWGKGGGADPLLDSRGMSLRRHTQILGVEMLETPFFRLQVSFPFLK